MRVLVVHNEYAVRGGEEVTVEREVALLRQKGHEVHVLWVRNEAEIPIVEKATLAIGAPFSLAGFRLLVRTLRDIRPDVVHVHNFFPKLSPSVFWACSLLGTPVVMTLHNYRIVCPTATLCWGGKVDERSIRRGPWWAVREKVYRGSLLGTLALVSMIALNKRLGTWRRRVDAFIVHTSFAKAKFIAAGVPGERIHVKPNFVDDAGCAAQRSSYFVFAGRLTEEKGVAVLLDALRRLPRIVVKFIGEGPFASEIEKVGHVYLGRLPNDAVRSEIAGSMGLIVPSLWYEGFPQVVVEAYSAGVPVIASRLGALAEIVVDGSTGLHVSPGDAEDLAQKLAWAAEHPSELGAFGQAARRAYVERYSSQKNYEMLLDIYGRAGATAQ